jgi:threonine-phosphate decarboxylase
VWYKVPPDWFYKSLEKALKKTIDYPHPEAGELKELLAVHHKLSAENICVTNGSVEGFYLLAQLFAEKKSLIITPSFAEYETACRRNNHKISFRLNSELLKNLSVAQNVVWLGNPNNPDGKTVSKNEIKKVLTENSDTVFIIDEAFAELSVGFQSALPLLKQFKNLVVIRSFTKAFSIPGIRLGYVLASQEIISELGKYTIPWSVNSIAVEAGKIILQNYNRLLPAVSEIKKENGYLFEKLNEFSQLKVFPANGNYFLIRLKSGDAADLKEFLAKRFGILIRDASNFRGLDKSYIRLSVQNKKNTELLISCLKSYFNEL